MSIVYNASPVKAMGFYVDNGWVPYDSIYAELVDYSVGETINVGESYTFYPNPRLATESCTVFYNIDGTVNYYWGRVGSGDVRIYRQQGDVTSLYLTCAMDELGRRRGFGSAEGITGHYSAGFTEVRECAYIHDVDEENETCEALCHFFFDESDYAVSDESYYYEDSRGGTSPETGDLRWTGWDLQRRISAEDEWDTIATDAKPSVDVGSLAYNVLLDSLISPGENFFLREIKRNLQRYLKTVNPFVDSYGDETGVRFAYEVVVGGLGRSGAENVRYGDDKTVTQSRGNYSVTLTFSVSSQFYGEDDPRNYFQVDITIQAVGAITGWVKFGEYGQSSAYCSAITVDATDTTRTFSYNSNDSTYGSYICNIVDSWVDAND